MSPANTSEKYLLPVDSLIPPDGPEPSNTHPPSTYSSTATQDRCRAFNYKWKALHGRSIPSTYSVSCNQERKGPENM